jgi:hypothetical protein
MLKETEMSQQDETSTNIDVDGGGNYTAGRDINLNERSNDDRVMDAMRKKMDAVVTQIDLIKANASFSRDLHVVGNNQRAVEDTIQDFLPLMDKMLSHLELPKNKDLMSEEVRTHTKVLGRIAPWTNSTIKIYNQRIRGYDYDQEFQLIKEEIQWFVKLIKDRYHPHDEESIHIKAEGKRIMDRIERVSGTATGDLLARTFKDIFYAVKEYHEYFQNMDLRVRLGQTQYFTEEQRHQYGTEDISELIKECEKYLEKLNGVQFTNEKTENGNL